MEHQARVQVVDQAEETVGLEGGRGSRVRTTPVGLRKLKRWVKDAVSTTTGNTFTE
jgi:hypothetical protein